MRILGARMDIPIVMIVRKVWGAMWGLLSRSPQPELWRQPGRNNRRLLIEYPSPQRTLRRRRAYTKYALTTPFLAGRKCKSSNGPAESEAERGERLASGSQDPRLGHTALDTATPGG